jgi:hypothetical protein
MFWNIWSCLVWIRRPVNTTKGTHNNLKQTKEFKLGDIMLLAKHKHNNAAEDNADVNADIIADNNTAMQTADKDADNDAATQTKDDNPDNNTTTHTTGYNTDNNDAAADIDAAMQMTR